VILKVGLTGGIASGKSTIVRMLAALGAITVDADAIVARLYRPGQAGYEAIVRTYGREILLADGEIDRKKLAGIAFSSSQEAQKLNALIHPLVITEQARLFHEAEERGEDAIFIVEATLLIESGGRQRFDRIVVVDVDPQTQMARAISRGVAEDEAKRRIANQLSREERLRHADYVIDNNGDEGAALAEAARVYESLHADLIAKKEGRLTGGPA
jgi:dephospho-CoA kinase